MNVQEITGRFDKFKPAGENQWSARCPCHEDRRNSLCIGVGDDGRILLHCQAGCETNAILEHVGLSMRDLMPEVKRNGRPGSEVVRRYDYRDEKGTLLYQVERRADKSFIQRRPGDQPGTWVYKLGNTRRVPYRLPELIESSGVVYIVEGEKDVERLVSLEMTATCNPGGASKSKDKSKWRDEYNDHLHGRNIIVIPDNDEPGRRHAEQVARTLVGKAGSIKVFELPGLPAKGDVSNWLDNGGTKDELIRLASACPEWEEPAVASTPYPESHTSASENEDYGARDPRRTITYHRITSAELDAGDYSNDYLIEGVLVAGQPGILAGAFKTLKTSVSIDMGISLSIGGHFLGYFNVNRACRVKIMTGESGLGTIQETARRIAHVSRHRLSDLSNLIWSPDLPRFGDLLHENALRKDLEDDAIEVLIVDPAYLCMPSKDAGNLMAQGELLRGMNEVCQSVGVTLIVDHHTSRGATRTRNLEPPELDDIAWAGFAEWARQWLLLGRREPFEPDSGLHKLWLNVGGSAGHSSLWALDVNEGVYDPESPRTWDVTISSARHERQEQRQQQERERCERERQKTEADKRKLWQAMQRFPDGETKNFLRELVGISGTRCTQALDLLVREGRVEQCKVTKNNKTHPGWKPVTRTTRTNPDFESDSPAEGCESD